MGKLVSKLITICKQFSLSLEISVKNHDLIKIREINRKMVILFNEKYTNLSHEELMAKEELISTHSHVLQVLRNEHQRLGVLLKNHEENKNGLSAYHSTELSLTY